MNASIGLCLFTVLVTPLLAAPKFHAEAGASVFFIRQQGQLEPGPAPLSVAKPTPVAPYLAGSIPFSERFGLRFSYHYLNDVHTTAEFGSPPGLPPSPLPIVVWGHFRDDVHLLSLMPGFKWRFNGALTVEIAPQLNWVASEGTISYSTNSALILLQAQRDRDDEDFTWGGSARLRWAFGPRSTLSVAYQYIDLTPSFQRRAHVVSTGLEWSF